MKTVGTDPWRMLSVICLRQSKGAADAWGSVDRWDRCFFNQKKINKYAGGTAFPGPSLTKYKTSVPSVHRLASNGNKGEIAGQIACHIRNPIRHQPSTNVGAV